MHANNPSIQVRKGARKRIQQLSILTCGVLIGFVSSNVLNSSILLHDMVRILQQDTGRPCSGLVQFPTSAMWPIESYVRDKYEKEDTSGWKDIHVFYGNTVQIRDATTLPTLYFLANKWFSQFRQDEIVSRLLHGKRGGYFVDLAANDPVRISNTYSLERHFDWNGLCLEPNPVYWSALSYRKCRVVGAVIGSRKMQEVTFRFPKEKAPTGGILGDQFDNKEDKYNEGRSRYTVTLLEIFDRFHVPPVIDYFSLDVEGAEDLVMASFPFSKYRFNVMTVERPSAELSGILVGNGYNLLTTIKRGTETLWVHQSILETIDMAALEIDSQNYKYRDGSGQPRIAPEDRQR